MIRENDIINKESIYNNYIKLHKLRNCRSKNIKFAEYCKMAALKDHYLVTYYDKRAMCMSTEIVHLVNDIFL